MRLDAWLVRLICRLTGHQLSDRMDHTRIADGEHVTDTLRCGLCKELLHESSYPEDRRAFAEEVVRSLHE